MRLSEHLLKEDFEPDAARELCRILRIFEVGASYKRSVITSRLRSAFIDGGGNPGTSKEKVAQVFKSWMRTDSPFERIDGGYGKYRYLGYGEQPSDPALTPAGEVQGRDTWENDAPSPDREYGDGPYEVYAWCLPRYREGPDIHWPIKIGRAGTDGLPRRFRDFWENLPEKPCYLIRFACADETEAREREQLLHKYFKSRGQKIEDSPGNEWFLTNTNEVIEAIRFIDPLSIVD